MSSFKLPKKSDHNLYAVTDSPPDAAQGITLLPLGLKRPRLLFSSSRLEDLRSRLDQPIEKEMLERLKARVSRIRTVSLPEKGSKVSDRGLAGLPPFPAFSYSLTGEPADLKLAKKVTLALCQCDNKDINDCMAVAQALSSISWSYDLLYKEWTPEERDQIQTFVKEIGTALFARLAVPVCYWGTTLLHNITILCWAGIGHAGLCFHDEFDSAKQWLLQAQRTFRTIAWLLSPDGSSQEGPSYGAFGTEQRLLYYQAARRCLGEDLFRLHDRNFGRWVLHLSLPNPEPKRNAIPWGDNPPYFDSHGPVHSLFALASQFRNPVVQGLAMDFWRKKIGAGSALEFSELLFYDPELKEQSLDGVPLSAHFEDSGMICSRSAWQGTHTTLVSFLCGPYQGHRAQQLADGDIGGSHRQADTASLQVFSGKEALLIDPGYERVKRTAHHNTILVNGFGQLGEGLKWFNVNRVLHYEGTARILSFKQDKYSTSWVGDAAEMYTPETGLKRFRRHVFFLRPRLIAVFDEVETEEAGVFRQLWHARTAFKMLPKPLSGQDYGFVQNEASLSILPVHLDAEAKPEDQIQIQSDMKAFPDLQAANVSLAELSVESPKRTSWNFLTIIVCGTRSEGPVRIRAKMSPPNLKLMHGESRSVTVRFHPDFGDAPKIVAST